MNEIRIEAGLSLVILLGLALYGTSYVRYRYWNSSSLMATIGVMLAFVGVILCVAVFALHLLITGAP